MSEHYTLCIMKCLQCVMQTYIYNTTNTNPNHQHAIIKRRVRLRYVHQQWVYVVYPMTQSNKTDAMRSWINTKPKPNPISKSSSCHYIRRWVQLRYVHCQSWSSQTPTQSYCRGWGCWTHFCIIFDRPILLDEPSLQVELDYVCPSVRHHFEDNHYLCS